MVGFVFLAGVFALALFVPATRQWAPLVAAFGVALKLWQRHRRAQATVGRRE